MSADDLIFIPVKIFSFALFLVIVFVAINKWKDALLNPVSSVSSATTFMTSGVTNLNAYAGYAFIAIFIGMILFSFIAAMQLPASILWAPLFMLITLVATWYSAPIAQGYETMMATTAFATYTTQMQIATLIMSRLPLMILIIGCTVALATYVKYRGEVISPV